MLQAQPQRRAPGMQINSVDDLCASCFKLAHLGNETVTIDTFIYIYIMFRSRLPELIKCKKAAKISGYALKNAEHISQLIAELLMNFDSV